MTEILLKVTLKHHQINKQTNKQTNTNKKAYIRVQQTYIVTYPVVHEKYLTVMAYDLTNHNNTDKY